MVTRIGYEWSPCSGRGIDINLSVPTLRCPLKWKGAAEIECRPQPLASSDTNLEVGRRLRLQLRHKHLAEFQCSSGIPMGKSVEI